jgi:hypothetical protein
MSSPAGSKDALNSSSGLNAEVQQFDKVVKRQRTLAKATTDGVDKLIAQLQQTKTMLNTAAAGSY